MSFFKILFPIPDPLSVKSGTMIYMFVIQKGEFMPKKIDNPEDTVIWEIIFCHRQSHIQTVMCVF